MSTFTQRMIGAATLDVPIYEEVEADRSAIGQAMGVVVLSSIASGIGAAGRGGPGIVTGLAAGLVAWFIWAGITYLVGTKLLPSAQTQADWGQLLRTTGFAASPGILRIFGFVPLLGWLVLAITSVWMLACMIVAVRQALDYTSTLRAIGVCLIGWLINLAIFAILIRPLR
jgi:hypothetical protein